DVVLMPMGEDDGLDIVDAVLDVREIRQDQIDARLRILGEEHAAVDDQQFAAVLEDRHVATDLADPAERDDPQAVLRQLRRRAEPGRGPGPDGAPRARLGLGARASVAALPAAALRTPLLRFT